MRHPTVADVERAYEEWLRQSRNVEAMVRRVRDTELRAIEAMRRSRGVVGEGRVSEVSYDVDSALKEVGYAEEIVQQAIMNRNKVEVRFFGRGAAAPKSVRSLPTPMT